MRQAPPSDSHASKESVVPRLSSRRSGLSGGSVGGVDARTRRGRSYRRSNGPCFRCCSFRNLFISYHAPCQRTPASPAAARLTIRLVVLRALRLGSPSIDPRYAVAVRSRHGEPDREAPPVVGAQQEALTRKRLLTGLCLRGRLRQAQVKPPPNRWRCGRTAPTVIAGGSDEARWTS